MGEGLKKIVVMHQASIGDTLLATSVFRAIKETYPACRVVAVTSHVGYEMLKGAEDIDVLLPYEKGDPVFPVFRAIWRADAAVILDLHYRNALYAFLAMIPKRIGLGKDFINIPIQDLEWQVYEPYKYLNFLRPIGVTTEHMQLIRPRPSAEEAARVREMCADLREAAGRKLVLLAPYSLDSLKDWEPPKYRELIRRLQKAGHVTAIIGGKAERPRADQDFPEAVNLAGMTNLRETAELIDQSDLLVCGCTSVLHISSTTSTASVAIYGPSSPKQWAPKQGCRVVTHWFPCSPCHNFGGEPCQDNRCIQEISVDEVWEAVQQELQAPCKGSGSAVQKSENRF